MAGLAKALAASVLVLNGQPSGTLQMATYDGHHADAKTATVSRHIPLSALQRWQYTGGVLTINTDQLYGSGFEAR